MNKNGSAGVLLYIFRKKSVFFYFSGFPDIAFLNFYYIIFIETEETAEFL